MEHRLHTLIASQPIALRGMVKYLSPFRTKAVVHWWMYTIAASWHCSSFMR